MGGTESTTSSGPGEVPGGGATPAGAVANDGTAAHDGAGRRGRWSPLRARPALADRPRLVLASFLMLFVELGLIRYTSANVVYLVHLTNFVLLASFLGIGLGFLRGRRRAGRLPAGAAGAGRPGRLRAGLPGQRRVSGRPPAGHRRVRDDGAAALAQPDRGLPADRCGDGDDRPGGRPHVRPAGAAGGVPAGRAREPHRHRGVRRAVLSPAAAAGLGGARRGRRRGAARPPDEALAVDRPRGARRPARSPDRARPLPLVAVLQGPRRDRAGRAQPRRLGEQRPAPDRVPDGPDPVGRPRSTTTRTRR